MSSEKLRKYLAYYQKLLKNDPENIEARLRLAAIFRELGKTSHAVDEYVTASKLLAKEGLPLEAIAACKAVLELDPTHTEVQFFLARLFAQVPDAGGATSRVAKPVEPSKTPNAFMLDKPKTDEFTRPAPRQDAITQDFEFDDEPTSAVDDDAGEADDNTSPLAKKDVDRALTEQRVDAVDTEGSLTDDLAELEEREKSVETRVAGYNENTLSGEEAFSEETFELGIFDLESFELDKDDIDLSFLDEFDPISESISESDLFFDPEPEVVSVSRSNLPQIPLFSQLSPEAFMELLQFIELKEFEDGAILLGPDQSIPVLNVIVKGKATVVRTIDGVETVLDSLDEGEFFGEFRLLTGRNGAASVRANGHVEVFNVSESVVEKIAESNPEIWDVLWNFYNARMLNNLLASGPIFKTLDAQSRGALADKFFLREAVADELLLEHGQECEHLFLVLLGEVAIERNRHGLTEELAALREGEFFGVASSLDGVPYVADVRVVRDSTLLCLPAQDFRDVVEKNPEVERNIDLFVSSRRRLNDAFTSGMTSYGELGLSPKQD